MKYTKENPLKVCTLFSGYDSQMLALQRLMQHHPDFGCKLVAWCEIEPAAIKAHNILFPDHADRNLGDICKVDWHSAPDFDLVTWSFPCQAISQAGKQQGLKEGSGTTSSLAYEALKCFEVKRPKYLLMENVPALLQAKFRKDWHDILRRLETMGYANFYQVMNTKDFGVPQNRKRVFMISILDNQNTPPQYEFPVPFPLEKRLKHILLPYGTVPEEYYLPQEKVEKILAHCDRKLAEGCGFKSNFQTSDGIAGAITTKYGGRETDVYIKEGLFADAGDGEGFTKAVSEYRQTAKIPPPINHNRQRP